MKKFNISGVSKLPQVEIAYGYADTSPIVFNALVDEGVGGSCLRRNGEW